MTDKKVSRAVTLLTAYIVQWQVALSLFFEGHAIASSKAQPQPQAQAQAQVTPNAHPSSSAGSSLGSRMSYVSLFTQEVSWLTRVAVVLMGLISCVTMNTYCVDSKHSLLWL